MTVTVAAAGVPAVLLLAFQIVEFLTAVLK